MGTIVSLWLLPPLWFFAVGSFWLWNAKLRRECDALLAEGAAHVQAAKYRQAVESYSEGFELASRIVLGREERAMLCALGSAEALKLAGQTASAYEAALSALMISAPDTDARHSLRLYTLVADLAEENRDPHRTVGLRQAAVALLRRFSPTSSALATQLNLLGTSLAAAGLPQHAANALSEAAEIFRQYPEDQSVYEDCLLKFGSVLGNLGHFERANEILQTVLSLARDNNGNAAAALRELGSLYCDWSRYEEAFAFFEEAYRIQVRSSGASDAQAGQILASYAEGLRKAGRLNVAEETAARAVKVLGQHRHPALISGLGTLGAVLLAEGNYSRAVEAFERADQASSTYQVSPLDTAERMESHAQALDALHRALDAEQLREGASSIRCALAAAPPVEEVFGKIITTVGTT